MRIGVDIGGTFMDFCAFDEVTNSVSTLKVLTTPDDPGRELAKGLELLQSRHQIDPHEISSFVHGTTVGINTIIQRKGCRLALITTAGFEDVIELARLRMPDVYSLFCCRPEHLIARDLVFGLPERMDAGGNVVAPIDLSGLPEVVAKLRAADVDGVIISFLHSYRNGAHEEACRAEIARLAPELFSFAASEIWPVIREYERTTTAILNGYVHPRIKGYLSSLQNTLSDAGVQAEPMLTRSNGGIMNVEAGKTNCVSMLLSGTASGVIGAAFTGRQAGVGELLTLDIGGTSADIALITDGEPHFGTGEVIGDFPLYVPSVSVTSIGAGGGSIAWVDDVGVLKVGPESAGSTPGPACYGRGGERPTVTDAMAVCGFIGQAPLAYGQLSVDADLARDALRPLAERLEVSVERAAEAIIQIAVSEMLVEVNKLAARAGIDLADFHLMPFGGAGPMLGGFLAEELGMERVLVPHRPGVISALGGLVADLRADFVQTIFETLGLQAMAKLQTAQLELRRKAEHWLHEEQGYQGEARLRFYADMRYGGQSHEIDVELDESSIAAADTATLRDAFDRAHLKLFDFNDLGAEVQVINLRAVIEAKSPAPVLATAPASDAPPEPEREICVWLDGRWQEVPLYARADLSHGQAFEGPAVVHQNDTTLCIPAGYGAQVDAALNIVLSKIQGGQS